LLEYVNESRGFDFTGYKRPSLKRRIDKRMQGVGATSYDAYREYLEREPDEYAELFNTILINVTAFFRDAESWEYVRGEIVPRILAARTGSSPIRCWSAGCASGEEAYTIAMLFADALGEEAFGRQVRIYATDVDDDALAQARRATYTAKQLLDVPEDLHERFFREANGTFVFRNGIRRCVIFGRNDLLQDPPISRVDLLASRNTLMYFGHDAQRRILANFSFALRRSGFLMLGKAEAVHSRTSLFEPYDLRRRIFVKALGDELEQAPRRAEGPAVESGRNAAEAALRDASFDQAASARIVLDTEGRLIAVSMLARNTFGLGPVDLGRRLQDLELSHRPIDLRSLVDQAQAQLNAVNMREVPWPGSNGEDRFLDVNVAPVISPQGELDGVAVTFTDVTRHRSLREELEGARHELEQAYEELQSTNEELETTNEELQSTNEELETTNEELQSTNEELETMNEELQSTNEELETMNDELRERTDDALRASAFLGSVLSGIPQAVAVVDEQFAVTAWSASATELWGLREEEVRGANFLNLDIGLPVVELRNPIRAVLAGNDHPPVVLDGHNRRGQPTSCTVSFAQLRSYDENVHGVILIVGASRPAEPEGAGRTL
jgi:two-component system CheB/CheR fusion protein